MSGSFKPAVRAGVGLLIGIAGPTGAGKTLSALRVARGLADGDDSRMAFIDTEAGRALHYAPRAGEPTGPFTFGFAHADMQPPFSPEAYLAKIEEAEKAGFAVIVIDSFSHEWAGDGGLQDIHDHEVDAAVERARRRASESNWRFDEDRERDKANVGAWRGPKMRHKRMMSRLLQCRAHLVICMRAEDKLRMVQKEEEGRNGRTFTKTEITPAEKLPPHERWAPICEKRVPYELITSLVLTPDAPGVPLPLKLQEQHKPYVPLDKPLDESVGRALAAWARGDIKTSGASSLTTAEKPPAARQQQDGGARPAAPPSDTFPGDLIAYGRVKFDPARPCPLDAPCAIDEMEAGEQTAFAKALGDLMKATNDAATRAAWIEQNQRDFLRLKALRPNLAGRLEELRNELPASPGERDGAPLEGAGASSGAPSQREAR